ncbi:hypothetical protein [Sphingomonas nostoxanthinifaciens]|uniref:hypothetical protein n=1 Tax=Sphingomonas nostoxanthinifaciens TaxID=2872652 RepID=UPI001CC1DF6B|nr:hypothetical protein [Sphingomonas nostoxanthinifaciens]UAK23698.1 hypothetical protein K8P63_15100 [Sphingomonas nostoxanthinifaciens]
MPDDQPMVSLDDPAYHAAIVALTAQVAAAAEGNGGDFNTPLMAVMFVLSMMLEADPRMATPGNLRKRSDEIGKVVLEQMRWMRRQRESTGQSMFHQMMREVADLSIAGSA